MLISEFVGQSNAKDNIELLVAASKKGRVFPHLALFGPAGSGKTSLAEIIAEELDAEYVYMNGSAITSPIIFRSPIAAAIKSGGKTKQYIIMIDEAHALNKKIQNALLSVLERPAILCTPAPKNIKLPNGDVIKKGDIIKEKLPDNVSFILGTTDKGRLSDALLSRLHSIDLVDYSPNEKIEAVNEKLAAHDMLTIDDGVSNIVAMASKGMRHLSKIVERLVDYATVNDLDVIKEKHVFEVLNILGIDKNGCDNLDRMYINYVGANDIVSVSNIARFLNVDEKQVKEKIEPFLVRRGWINITPRGRKLTNSAIKTFFSFTVPNSKLNDIMIELDLV